MIGHRILFRVRQVARWFGYDLIKVRRRLNALSGAYGQVYPGATYSPWMNDAGFEDTFQTFSPYSLVDRYRSYELWELVSQALKLEGDILEVGVWRGGSGLLIAERLRQLGAVRKVFLCDTFEGIVKAGAKDTRIKDGMYADTSAESVASLAASSGLNNVVVIKGTFPDDVYEQLESINFSFCHIDVDTYQGCKDTLEWLWPRLASSGIVVFDDYGFFGTAGVATYLDEIKSHPACEFIHNLNGHGIIIKRRDEVPEMIEAS